MTIDFGEMLYDPVYDRLGVSATLTVATVGEVALTVIDDLKPKAIANGSAEVRTVAPGAFARIPELTTNGIEVKDCTGATLTFNGRTWAIYSHEKRGSPNGEDAGEVRFLLKEAAVG
jgi:hypothetical protein